MRAKEYVNKRVSSNYTPITTNASKTTNRLQTAKPQQQKTKWRDKIISPGGEVVEKKIASDQIKMEYKGLYIWTVVITELVETK